MAPKKPKKNVTKLEEALEECHITPSQDTTSSAVVNDTIDPKLLSKWPKLKMRVPTIFLHKTVDLAEHVHEILLLGINFYHPYLGTNYTKIICQSFNDHKAMVQYFDKNKLPYHTFGDPSKRKMKVVIRGLPKDVDLDKLKQEFKSANIPVVRIHKMHMKEFAKERDPLILAVVPYNDEGKNLLKVKQIFGYDVKMEPPNPKIKQCHRCQKWGHSQRYCRGQVKCVKCAGDHFSNKCTRDPDVEPPMCANCGGNHTASYQECFCCPDSAEYKSNKANKIKKYISIVPHRPRQLVTLESCNNLYQKVKHMPKHAQAVPF